MKKTLNIKQLCDEYLQNEKIITTNFVIYEKPIAYARARKGRGGFYNPKSEDKERYKKLMKSQRTVDQALELDRIISNENVVMYVEIKCKFYIPINKTDSQKVALLKDAGAIPAVSRNGDVDNYTKFILDALHEVIYADDKVVTSISSKKYFSTIPRTEVEAVIHIIKE